MTKATRIIKRPGKGGADPNGTVEAKPQGPLYDGELMEDLWQHGGA